MTVPIELRNQKVTDPERFFEILSNPKFIYFTADPKSVDEEIDYLKENEYKREKNIEYNYTIIYDNEIVGGCGIKIDQHRKYIGEIGYFVDEKFWNRGIAKKAVKLLEEIGFNKLKLTRIEIRMNPENLISEKVALSCGYKKEGLLKKVIKEKTGFADALIYAKTI